MMEHNKALRGLLCWILKDKASLLLQMYILELECLDYPYSKT